MGVVGTVGAVSLSVVSSVSIVICNKALMSAFGFIFATTLASWHLLFAFCSLHVALCMKLFEHKPFDARTVMGFGVLKGISVGLLNLSLSYNSVGFYQMTKLAVIPCTAILETLFFRKFSRYIQLSLGVLLFGVGVATVTDPQLNAMGFVLSLLALITTCIAQIITKTIQKKFELSSTQLLYQSCPYQALTLFVVGPFLDGFLTNKNVFAFEYTPQVLFFIVLSCLLSFSMYFSSALLIGKTSAVTDLVLGHLKIWLVLAFGYVVLHDPFSWRNILGKLIAVVGIGLYSYCTSAPSLVMASPTLKKKKKKVMASPVLLPNRVKLLYKGHQILNVILGILIGLIAVLRWYTGRADFDSTVILMCLVNSSMLFVLPQSMISIYCFFQKGRCVGLEAYIWTAAMVLDDYVALLMINIEYISIVMIPGMILVLIGTLGWKLRKSTMEAEKHQTNEEILSVEKTNSSDKLVLFEFVSYLLQLSLVTWTQYKGQQGSTPVLSDFLLFLCSALGAFGVMLDSPLGGVNSREVSSVQVLPVLHKTCTVVLFIAVHTLAAEWLGEDMIYVCLPELLVVLVWFTICFGESMSVSSFTSHKSELIMVSSVVAILAGLISLNANDRNMRVTWIIWAFWISLSSSAFSQFHVWLLHGWPHGWPGSSSESNKLIRLLKVASTVGSSTAAILCAYMMVTDPRILYEAISSFEHKAIAALVPIIFLLTFLVWSAHLETQIHKIPVSRKLSDMLENKLHRKLYKLLKALEDALPSGVREDITFLQAKLGDMHPIITCFEW